MSPRRPFSSFTGFRILGILIIFVAGIFACAHPYLGVYPEVSDDFLTWMRATGIILMFHGVILFVAYVLGRADDKEAIGISVVFTAIYLFMAYMLFSDAEMIPLFGYEKDKLVVLEDSEVKDTAVRIVVGSVMAIMVVTIIQNLVLFFRQLKLERG